MLKLRIAMAQINSTVGALSENAKKIIGCAKAARSLGCGLVIFPELAVTGYPPEDLLLKPKFIEDNISVLKRITKALRGITAVVGFVDRDDDIYNSAAVIQDTRLAGVYRKMYLPNYGVFDEERYFQAGSRPLNFRLNGVTIGVGICEDIWYPEGPARSQALAGAEVIININASPYHAGKLKLREEMLATRAMDNGVIIAYNNMVGGQDELVFDGQGMVINERGGVIARGRAFEEDLIVTDLDIEQTLTTRLRDTRMRQERLKENARGIDVINLTPARKSKKLRPIPERRIEPLERSAEVLKALTLGTGDYVGKNGFKHVVVGLSGGIDSSLVAGVAAIALGKENVTGVFMPSQYTSRESREDVFALVKNLGIELIEVPITGIFREYLKTIKPSFRGKQPDTTEENMQARIRGNILMAMSNKFGWLVLTTGNKSEMSVGYATLYGDMAGGFAVIKDVPKTLVYELSAKLNELSERELIPKRVFTKAPTAELKPDQTDQDTLPTYPVLDGILKPYVEEDKSPEEIIALGFSPGIVKKVIKMVDASEYKRRQAPPGIKITPRALGKDRRMPITNRYGSGYS
ncbi:MAG: NAD+ synthase [Deltaproteobacteria bacterium]|nr:NAD+ synthase [Deltaproteobacteria bacterium]